MNLKIFLKKTKIFTDSSFLKTSKTACTVPSLSSSMMNYGGYIPNLPTRIADGISATEGKPPLTSNDATLIMHNYVSCTDYEYIWLWCSDYRFTSVCNYHAHVISYAILIQLMPPTHTTLTVPICEAGFYDIPLIMTSCSNLRSFNPLRVRSL